MTLEQFTALRKGVQKILEIEAQISGVSGQLGLFGKAGIPDLDPSKALFENSDQATFAHLKKIADAKGKKTLSPKEVFG